MFASCDVLDKSLFGVYRLGARYGCKAHVGMKVSWGWLRDAEQG